jgi:2'-5' RNA ligase
MAHSVELLFDPESDEAIRREWRTLADAGLPSQANHRSPTNRPHVTLTAATAIDPAVDGPLGALAATLPVSCRVGAPIVFGSGRFTLVRSIVPTPELLRLHAAVDEMCLPHLPDGSYAHTRPRQWTAHVTLARRMTAPELTAALALLADSDVVGTFTALRRWDGDAREQTLLN